ncbi:MAG: hypothetical protein NZ696_00240 [Thermomicrobium sp.]|nr:hypothetical protein [Thermomicrobium sp.]MDW7981699.1 hypothetical protein [Thermomicrobium sp.]
MDVTTADIVRALALWLPAGTLGPYLGSRLTGADQRTAFLEAIIFALGGLLVYPTLLGLVTARFIDWQATSIPVESLFVGGFLCATVTLILMRRAAHRLRAGSRSRRWTSFR